ncbi:MAG: ABC transporter permease [Candidatus Latescibacteria bacterium]|jgi:lipopolysaccharide transport system permease protein|nr:ABC transporter permease [Candidatus Latescibacterota bacterium]
MNKSHNPSETWDIILQPKTGLFELHFRDIWRYRDLIILFVKRDFVTFYKQTILGPLWYFLQPLLMTIVFTIIFGKVARISTDGLPPFLFYLSGTVAWNYFAGCLTETSNTFISNASIFGKVYFPRLTVPISVVVINLLKFSIQLLLFLGFYCYFIVMGTTVKPTFMVLILPLFIFQMAMLGLGVGILVSSLTTKYRDLNYLMNFFVQIWMYSTPVVFPASIIPDRFLPVFMLNPMASIIEVFRAVFLGTGMINWGYIAISWGITLCILFLGIILFNRIEKSFMDTV